MTHTRAKGLAPAEIHLNPGDFYFGDGNVRLHTLLGSCVAITLWHPVLRFGGMCHFMLPCRQKAEAGAVTPDGRYGDEAMQMFLAEIARYDTRPGEYQAKIFGGGSMFQTLKGGIAPDVAGRNVTQARALLRDAGFDLCAEDVGGNGHRRIIFNLNDGNVWVRHEKSGVKCAA
jgi:chemotaxis protein CheD